MCAIVGYTGYKPAIPILLDGLRSVEYKGYDSVGIYLPLSGPYKNVGKVEGLVDILPDNLVSTAGIAHIRWATHGVPSLENTHPLTDTNKNVWIVHNGMIENHDELRQELQEKGHIFTSETDSEILAHLIADEYEKCLKPHNAVAKALEKVVGTYGLAVMFSNLPDTIVIASMGNKMSIGIKDGEYIIASETAPMLRHTSNVVQLRDGEYAIVTPQGYTIYSFDHEKLSRKPKTIDIAKETALRKDVPHNMMKDILELPRVLENSARGRVIMQEGTARFGGLDEHMKELSELKRLIIVGCGSSYYAGLIGKLMLEDYVKIPVEVVYGSEFINRKVMEAQDGTIVLGLSQSGETPDIIDSLAIAKKAGIRTYGLVNVVGSTISKMVDTGMYNHAGPEQGVRSTKGYISQIEVLALMTLELARIRGLSKARGAEFIAEIKQLPDKVRTILKERRKIKKLAEEYLGYDDFLLIGRKYNIASAHEGALKLKKVSYVHAESFPAGEVKNGPIAMLNEIFPTIAIMPSDSVYDAMRKDVELIRERGGPILAITTEGNMDAYSFADDVIFIPDTRECFSPILANIPLQLFAYYSGALRGFSQDAPLRPSNVVTFDQDTDE